RVFWFARRYRHFPMFSTWSILVNTLGHQLPSLLFLAFFSPALAGTYLLVQRVTAGPLTTIGQAAGQVYLSEAADAHRQGRLGTLSLRMVDALVRLSVGPAVLFAWAAPELFGAVF